MSGRCPSDVVFKFKCSTLFSESGNANEPLSARRRRHPELDDNNSSEAEWPTETCEVGRRSKALRLHPLQTDRFPPTSRSSHSRTVAIRIQTNHRRKARIDPTAACRASPGKESFSEQESPSLTVGLVELQSRWTMTMRRARSERAYESHPPERGENENNRSLQSFLRYPCCVPFTLIYGVY